jgi:exosortase
MAAWGILLLGFFWTYWDTIIDMVQKWYSTPDLQHGFVVPIFAGFLLWFRQEMVDPWPNRGTWWGLAFFAVFALVRWLCLFFKYERDIDSLLFFLLGMTLIVGGWRALRWAWPSILFLEFMVPLPEVVAGAASRILQRIATEMSVYVLQTLGIPAIAQGNVIQLSDPESKLDIERACSGLKMMTVFFAICVGVSLVMQMPAWKKVLLIVSAVPIAIISNVLRIVLTGVLFEYWSKTLGNWVHDNAGWWMMFPAMLMIWGEMSLLSALLIETSMEGPLSFGKGDGPRAPGTPGPRRSPAGGPGPLGPQPAKPRGSPRV